MNERIDSIVAILDTMLDWPLHKAMEFLRGQGYSTWEIRKGFNKWIVESN